MVPHCGVPELWFGKLDGLEVGFQSFLRSGSHGVAYVAAEGIEIRGHSAARRKLVLRRLVGMLAGTYHSP